MRPPLWNRLLGHSLWKMNSSKPNRWPWSIPSLYCIVAQSETLSFSTEAQLRKKLKIPSCYDPYGPRSAQFEKILKLAEEIASLPPEERKQIGSCLRDKLRAPRIQMISVDGAAAISQAGPASGGAAKAEEKKAEKTAFNIKLEKFDAAAKIKVIKEVRAFTDLGLKEAKEIVEKAPVILKQGVTKEEASDIIEKIKAVGGIAVME